MTKAGNRPGTRFKALAKEAKFCNVNGGKIKLPSASLGNKLKHVCKGIDVHLFGRRYGQEGSQPTSTYLAPFVTILRSVAGVTNFCVCIVCLKSKTVEWPSNGLITGWMRGIYLQ